MKITNIKVASHRNGVCGWPFWVVSFDWQNEDRVSRRMVATIPYVGEDSKLNREDCIVCVLCVDQLAAGDVAFGSNSWRGDHFADRLWKAIDEYEIQRWAEIFPPAWQCIDAYSSREGQAEALFA